MKLFSFAFLWALLLLQNPQALQADFTFHNETGEPIVLMVAVQNIHSPKNVYCHLGEFNNDEINLNMQNLQHECPFLNWNKSGSTQLDLVAIHPHSDQHLKKRMTLMMRFEDGELNFFAPKGLGEAKQKVAWCNNLDSTQSMKLKITHNSGGEGFGLSCYCSEDSIKRGCISSAPPARIIVVKGQNANGNAPSALSASGRGHSNAPSFLGMSCIENSQTSVHSPVPLTEEKLLDLAKAKCIESHGPSFVDESKYSDCGKIPPHFGHEHCHKIDFCCRRNPL